MSNPYAEHTQAKATERIAAALERIATAVEAQAAADPLTMLSMALEAEGADTRSPEDIEIEDRPAWMMPNPRVQAQVASNGYVVIYQHPDPESGLEIVARRDDAAPGGWCVEVEPK